MTSICEVCSEPIYVEANRTTFKCEHEYHIQCLLELLKEGGECPGCSKGETSDNKEGDVCINDLIPLNITMEEYSAFGSEAKGLVDKIISKNRILEEEKSNTIEIDGYTVTLKKSENKTKVGTSIYYIESYLKDHLDDPSYLIRFVYSKERKSCYGIELVVDTKKRISIVSERIFLDHMRLKCTKLGQTIWKPVYDFKDTLLLLYSERGFKDMNYVTDKTNNICAKFIKKPLDIYTGMHYGNGQFIVPLTEEEEQKIKRDGLEVGSYLGFVKEMCIILDGAYVTKDEPKTK